MQIGREPVQIGPVDAVSAERADVERSRPGAAARWAMPMHRWPSPMARVRRRTECSIGSRGSARSAMARSCSASSLRARSSASRPVRPLTIAATGPSCLVARTAQRQQVLARRPAECRSAAACAPASSPSASIRVCRRMAPAWSAASTCADDRRCRDAAVPLPGDGRSPPAVPDSTSRAASSGIGVGEPIGALPQPDRDPRRPPEPLVAGRRHRPPSRSSAMAIGSGRPRQGGQADRRRGAEPARAAGHRGRHGGGFGGLERGCGVRSLPAASAAMVGQQTARLRWPAATRRAAASTTSRATADVPRLPSVNGQLARWFAEPAIESRGRVIQHVGRLPDQVGLHCQIHSPSSTTRVLDSGRGRRRSTGVQARRRSPIGQYPAASNVDGISDMGTNRWVQSARAVRRHHGVG